MNYHIEKPKQTPAQIVNMMDLDKGVKFVNISKENAISFLSDKNNYLRVASYRKNYDKHLLGENKDKYIDLDFAYLIELSKIDMHLRFFILKMCLDLEYDLKMKILEEVPIMKEIDKNKLNEANKKKLKEELFSIPNESSCSPEFSEGCVISESGNDNEGTPKK